MRNKKVVNKIQFAVVCLVQKLDFDVVFGCFFLSVVLHLTEENLAQMNTGGLQHLDLFSPFKTFDQGGIFIVPRLPRHGASVSAVSFDRTFQLRLLLLRQSGCTEDLF